jgi:hypothetical protein
MGHSLWRENGSAVYNSYWFSPAQSFLGPSPVRLVTIFYWLRFETPPIWRARSPYLYPPGTGLTAPSLPGLQNSKSKSKSKSKLLYVWRLTANQFVLASSTLRLTTRDFFPQLNPCDKPVEKLTFLVIYCHTKLQSQLRCQIPSHFRSHCFKTRPFPPVSRRLFLNVCDNCTIILLHVQHLMCTLFRKFGIVLMLVLYDKSFLQ